MIAFVRMHSGLTNKEVWELTFPQLELEYFMIMKSQKLHAKYVAYYMNGGQDD